MDEGVLFNRSNLHNPPAYIFFVRKNAFSRFDQFSQPELGVECPGPLLFDLYIKVRASVFGKEECLINQALAVEHLLDFEYN